MRRSIGRRSLFFAGVVLVSLALVPATPGDFRWVAWFTAALAAFWSILLGAEELTRPRAERQAHPSAEVEMPFAPPPPPGKP
ncbi:MAG TPA: hypothetical protein VF972_07395 [Actinomycetota bacterium]